MSTVVRQLTLAGIVMLFLLGGPMLDMIGWTYTSAGGSFVTKIHPSFFILFLAAGVALLSGKDRYWQQMRKPWFLAYTLCAILLVARAVAIASTGVTQGELSAAMVTFLMPAFLLVAAQSLSRTDFDRIGVGLRFFFIFNSLMGLAERLAGHRFIPSFIDAEGKELRAAALLSHPLDASLLTGIMIVFLVSARKKSLPVWMRVPEILLHGMAMFAFGGRSALVFTTIVLIFSAVVVRQDRSQNKIGPLQRFLPIAILIAGVALIFLPIPFVEATLARFSNDNASSETRNAAFQMLTALDPAQLLWGADANRRTIIMAFFHSERGIEIAWIALIMIYGAILAAFYAVTMPLMLMLTARRLDRSALYMALLFIVVTAGSLSLGSKTMLISQLLTMMLALCQKQVRSALFFRVPTGEEAHSPAPLAPS
ncbi:VpsF family polysaccharide biosynthesis protein [Sphingobium sp.]|uniref:VpsF family polysaccharide biosynthesis protein n=1 Tax=Sphingobium sp. TaxID=1912891 RepID=UPI003BB5F25A